MFLPKNLRSKFNQGTSWNGSQGTAIVLRSTKIVANSVFAWKHFARGPQWVILEVGPQQYIEVNLSTDIEIIGVSIKTEVAI